MNVTSMESEGLLTLEPRVFEDERGCFFESFNAERFAEVTGVATPFVQDNHSVSHKGVLRGLHYQLPPFAQGKLVRVVRGAIFDVAVNIRRASPTFGKWAALTLSAENRRQLWIPPGFAHGFLALEERTEVVYKTTALWNADSERAIRWDDADIGIAWPLEGTPIISSKDAGASLLADAETF